MDTIYLSGGCFWGVEELFQKEAGVHKTEVGYTGGFTANPTYNDVKGGASGHAEALKIEFDPQVTSYEALLKFFFSIHDPTTLNQQGNDRGSQYRSAIFYLTPGEKKISQNVIAWAQPSWESPILTQLELFGTWYSAEDYHQDYLKKNPGGYTCHWKRF